MFRQRSTFVFQGSLEIPTAILHSAEQHATKQPRCVSWALWRWGWVERLYFIHTSGSSTFWHPILLSPNGAHISTSSCGPSAGDPPLPDLQGAGAARSCSSLNVLFQCSRYLILSPGLFSVHFLPSCLPLLYCFLSPSLQCQEYRRFCPPGSAGDVQHCLKSALSLLESTKRGWVFLFAFSKTRCCLSRKCSVPTR